MVNAIQQFTTSPTTLTSPFTPVLEFNVPVTGIVINKIIMAIGSRQKGFLIIYNIIKISQILLLP